LLNRKATDIAPTGAKLSMVLSKIQNAGASGGIFQGEMPKFGEKVSIFKSKVPNRAKSVKKSRAAVKTAKSQIKNFGSKFLNSRSEILTGGAKVPLVGAKGRAGKAGVYHAKGRWAGGGVD
jgi:hypothetical protein